MTRMESNPIHIFCWDADNFNDKFPLESLLLCLSNASNRVVQGNYKKDANFDNS